MHDFNRKLYGTATVGTKGQVVIPSLAREELNIKEGDKFYIVGTPKMGVVALLPEDLLTEMIDNLSLNIELLKEFKNKEK